MKQSWEDYEDAADRGPVAIFFKAVWPLFLAVAILSILFGTLGVACGWCGEATKTAQSEYGPKALLEKYAWFKDASAQLDKKLADIKVYESRIKKMEESYKETPRSKWPREDREQHSVWMSEVAGAKASYNALAAEYNAGMAKFNWKFANQGDLPAGAKPLPREYGPYVEE